MALKLQLSLLVIAHAVAMGHRGVKATEQALKETFCWVGLQVDAATFIRECLQCRCIEGGGIGTPPDRRGAPRRGAEYVGALRFFEHADWLHPRHCVDDASGLCQLTWHDR